MHRNWKPIMNQLFFYGQHGSLPWLRACALHNEKGRQGTTWPHRTTWVKLLLSGVSTYLHLGGERHCESRCLTQEHRMMTPRPGLKKVWIACSGGKCTNLNLRAIIAFQADLLKLVTPWSRVAPQNCLLDGQAISIHWWLAFVSKEPIPCSVNVDTSVVCQVLICIVWAHLYCEIFAFEGQNVENNNFSMKSNVGYKCCI